MEREYGKKEWETAIDTMEIIEMIRSGAMESSLGQAEMYTRGITKAI